MTVAGTAFKCHPKKMVSIPKRNNNGDRAEVKTFIAQSEIDVGCRNLNNKSNVNKRLPAATKITRIRIMNYIKIKLLRLQIMRYLKLKTQSHWHLFNSTPL